MVSKRERMRGRRDAPSFSMLIHAYFESPEYAELTARAVKALVDLYCQFRGSNNGDLCAAWATMSKRGWTSHSQLAKALDELLSRGWISITRQGGKHVATLYAVSFLGIDACGGKLDVSACPTPAHTWKHDKREPAIEIPNSGRRVKRKACPSTRGNVSLHTGQKSATETAIDPRHGTITPTLAPTIAPPHGTLSILIPRGDEETPCSGGGVEAGERGPLGCAPVLETPPSYVRVPAPVSDRLRATRKSLFPTGVHPVAALVGALPAEAMP